MMQSMKLALVALCMCVGAVSASADGHIKVQIEAANDALAAAIAAGDAEAAGAAYTMDGQALPPGGTVITGPAAIGAMWKSVRESGIAGAELNTLEVFEHGDTATEVGSFALSNEEGAVVATGKYVVLWKLEDGAWKLHRDIWNADPAAE